MPALTIILAGAWQGKRLTVLAAGNTLRHYAEKPNYVARLTDDHAALILVDGTDPDWRFWTTTPKTSPATRRIPILLIADDPSQAADALLAGADLVLPLDQLHTQFAQLIQDYARVQSPEAVEQLDDECQQPLPDLARQGVEKFNQREFYKQHDLFEALWVQTESPVRDLYRAILQVGVAYYQILRGNYRGAHKMLLRSVQWLALLPDQCQGVDVAQLKADSYRVRAELERLGEDHIDQFDQTLLKPIQLK